MISMCIFQNHLIYIILFRLVCVSSSVGWPGPPTMVPFPLSLWNRPPHTWFPWWPISLDYHPTWTTSIWPAWRRISRTWWGSLALELGIWGTIASIHDPWSIIWVVRTQHGIVLHSDEAAKQCRRRNWWRDRLWAICPYSSTKCSSSFISIYYIYVHQQTTQIHRLLPGCSQRSPRGHNLRWMHFIISTSHPHRHSHQCYLLIPCSFILQWSHHRPIPSQYPPQSYDRYLLPSLSLRCFESGYRKWTS